ncbi:MAG: ABC-type transport auxiliary lipoprotein family protein [Propylenella sp.]
MEIRARYVLVGLFSLAVILAGFGFVYWLENFGGLAERTSYRIRFENSVSGLLLGSAVQFNGIRVGEVTDLKLNPADPREVLVTIAVAADTPVRADTRIGLAFGGLTGVPEVALSGGTPDAPAPLSTDGEPPLLVAEAAAAQDWTEAAREAFSRIDSLLAENSDALKNTLANLDTFSSALAKNADKVEGLLAGLERLTGGGAGRIASVLYSLTPLEMEVASVPSEGQLMVALPSAPLSYDTPKFLVQSGEGEATPFDDAQWADTLPRMLQSAIVRSFENAGYTRVGTDMQGIAADRTLMLDIRRFRISADSIAEIDLTAKIADVAGALIAERRFQASAPAAAMEAEAAAKALDQAFGKAVAELVPWALAAP